MLPCSKEDIDGTGGGLCFPEQRKLRFN